MQHTQCHCITLRHTATGSKLGCAPKKSKMILFSIHLMACAKDSTRPMTMPLTATVTTLVAPAFSGKRCVCDRMIQMYDTTHQYVWNDAFICLTWIIHMSDMTHSHVCHDLSIRMNNSAKIVWANFPFLLWGLNVLFDYKTFHSACLSFVLSVSLLFCVSPSHFLCLVLSNLHGQQTCARVVYVLYVMWA